MSLSESDIERIVTAVETMEASLAVLADKQALSAADYRSDPETRDVVERRFVKLTEAALDIAKTLAVDERDERPKSNPAAMIVLGDADIIDETTTQKMAEAARFRNVLAHTYGGAINHEEVYEALGDLERYRDFLIAVRTHLSERGVLE
ncbi:type VII toxin-antitoxin system HepT family RNase toxin [Natranaeroarchaeum aerophilus]|uniref:DUF86 domain-containing protein n=1 Tax=Natranaeroarchaeum aerophilus TaxID=2917711 RepID=A0AAE3FQZ2_9EURY|nr:DUF86 domain-containing protein [Natranaeroarchaeum aerophilus]MCL9813480.1 DUF86 domain-containing protein [Natranaeroarchaeum aerophilus]